MNRAVCAWLLAASACALAGGCARETPAPEVVRPILAHRVSLKSQPSLASYAGEVKARSEADLGFRIPGKVVQRAVDVGERVRKGQLLARIDPSDVALQADAAQAQVAAAQTEHALAKAELDRYRGLVAQRFVSQSVVDQKQAAFDAASSRLDQARAQLAVARNQASYAALAATADGVVTAVGAEAGQVVAAGQMVVRVAERGAREVAISVPENRIGELRSAPSLAISLWADRNRTFEGRLREVSASVDATTRTFAARVAFVAPDEQVQLGMTANVLVPSAASAGALVPATSIYHAGSDPAVWVFDPATGKVGLRKVTLGAFREDGAVILSGLADGEIIVAAGVNKLAPGQTVRLLEPGAAPRG